jgi:two-component system response regulator AtoC
MSTETIPEGEAALVLSGEAERRKRIALVLHHGEGAEMVLLETGRPVVVGRSHPSSVCIPDPKLSRQHASFTLMGDQVIVQDRGSTNGSWIGGARIQKAEIRIGGEVVLGNTVARIHALGSSTNDIGLSALGDERSLVAGSVMREVLETVSRVAASRIPVVLQGETGTGKEVIAGLIHDRGPRRHKPMVPVNCGAIPLSLVEGTLFGHERGAFTGAIQQQKGVFEEADGGTVFLDEIAELSLVAQASLLRVLETGKFCRVGSSRELSCDVRVIAATHQDLEVMCENGRFRSDLFYRLNAITINIPPLRERPDEIELLAMRFLQQANQLNQRHVQGIEPTALAVLRSYRWPGNVRELKNAIERAVVITSTDKIGVKDLPARVRGMRSAADSSPRIPQDELLEEGEARTPFPTNPPDSSSSGELRARVQEYEAQIISEALRLAGGNRTQAARQLGMPVRTLTHKIKMLGIKGDK